MKPSFITENYIDDLNCIEMDKIEALHQIRLLLSQNELSVNQNPVENYPYRTMDVFDDINF